MGGDRKGFGRWRRPQAGGDYGRVVGGGNLLVRSNEVSLFHFTVGLECVASDLICDGGVDYIQTVNIKFPLIDILKEHMDMRHGHNDDFGVRHDDVALGRISTLKTNCLELA